MFDSLNFLIIGKKITIEIDEAITNISLYTQSIVNGFLGVLREHRKESRLCSRFQTVLRWHSNIILTRVRPGSTIINDCLKSYHDLGDQFRHLIVSHSIEFVDSTSGACTYIIDGYTYFKMSEIVRQISAIFNQLIKLLINQAQYKFIS
ncbi:hypothetical protein HZS_1348 [Henneguya salminicola]|nr:hypothetical protein HZS_1348 [Henneguya salminicola]